METWSLVICFLLIDFLNVYEERPCVKRRIAEMSSYYQYLAHHGILGQKWGKRNGPPYPLGVSDHSASEKRAGWRKSLDNGGRKANNKKQAKDGESRKGLSSGQKKAIAIGATAVAAALATYGVYKLSQSGKLDPLIARGKQRLEHLLGDASIANQKVNSFSEAAQKAASNGIKSLGHKESISEAVKKVNPSGSNTNCRACSIASILRMRGMDVEALGTVKGGQLREAVESCFKDAKVTEIYSPSRERITNYILKHFGEGSSGVLAAEFDFGLGSNGEHAINWAVKDGKISFFDGQSGNIDCSAFLNKITKTKEAGIARLDHLEINPEGIKKFIKIR